MLVVSLTYVVCSTIVSVLAGLEHKSKILCMCYAQKHKLVETGSVKYTTGAMSLLS